MLIPIVIVNVLAKKSVPMVVRGVLILFALVKIHRSTINITGNAFLKQRAKLMTVLISAMEERIVLMPAMKIFRKMLIDAHACQAVSLDALAMDTIANCTLLRFARDVLQATLTSATRSPQMVIIRKEVNIYEKM